MVLLPVNTVTKYILVLGIALTACTPQSPQIPSQRMSGHGSSTERTDSATLALMELNKQLALAADQQLLQLAQAQEESYALYEMNTWITILDAGDTDSPTPALDEVWTLRMRTYTTARQLLMDSEASYRIGRQELPQAVEANIGEWHRGAKVRLLAPWYAAYGLQGTPEIPPYENVIIEIELK